MIKLILFVFSIIVGLTSNANCEELYKCQLTSVKKSTSNINAWTKTAFLSKNRFSRVNFSYDSHTGTDLNLLVSSDETLQGTVNGQNNFILQGNIKSAQFESAYSKGTITCSNPVNVEVGFVFKPWKTIYVQGDLDTIINLKSSHDIKNSCYFGNAERAFDIVQNTFKLSNKNISLDKSNGDIKVIFLEKSCTSSIGTNIDDYQCLSWSAPQPVQYTLNNCDYDPYP